MFNVNKNHLSRQTGMREAFLNPSDSYFLFADLGGFYTHWTYMHIFLSNYWWQKSDIWSQASYKKCYEKWAYMFNVNKNHLSRQTGIRNLTGPKTLPTIWYTYMMLVTKYQILPSTVTEKNDIWSQASYRYPISWEAFLNPSDSYFLFVNFVDFYTHWTYMLIFRRIFLSNCWWQNLI
jgi:hypothetical protein